MLTSRIGNHLTIFIFFYLSNRLLVSHRSSFYQRPCTLRSQKLMWEANLKVSDRNNSHDLKKRKATKNRKTKKDLACTAKQEVNEVSQRFPFWSRIIDYFTEWFCQTQVWQPTLQHISYHSAILDQSGWTSYWWRPLLPKSSVFT